VGVCTCVHVCVCVCVCACVCAYVCGCGCGCISGMLKSSQRLTCTQGVPSIPTLLPQDGFLLDRGFQIFLTGYKEAQVLKQALAVSFLIRVMCIGCTSACPTAPVAPASVQSCV